jgi:hypothetical protein
VAREHDYTVAAEHEYAFYTRYPGGPGGWPREAEDLTCPKCGDDRIVILWESGAEGMLGDKARCWTCKHKFTVTENCWKWRKVNNG